MIATGAVAGAVAMIWFLAFQTPNERSLHEGLFSGNGRVEATEIKVAAKFAGRIVEITPDEGDDVERGDIIVRLDDREAAAGLAQVKAEYEMAVHALHSAKADVERRKSERTYAEDQFRRSSRLFDQGNISQQRLDLDANAAATAVAAFDAAQARLMQTEAQLASAQAQVDLFEVMVSETEIAAPISGRVLFRVAEPGEIIQPGGNVLLLVDLDRLFMTIFLDEASAGNISVGDEALIWTDAYPDRPFLAKVSYISSEAEFTPKEVQTRAERQALVFRVKISALNNDERLLKPGMPGVGLIRTSGDIAWPATLEWQ